MWKSLVIIGDPPLPDMKFDPGIHDRRSIRLKGYDYSRAGAYFLTIDIDHKENLLGEIIDGAMQLNRCGQIVQYAWFDLPKHYPHVELDAFCIMPNHVHGIIVLDHDASVGAGLSGLPSRLDKPVPGITEDPRYPRRPAPTKPMVRHPLSEVIRAFKSFSARRINAIQGVKGVPVWQRNYYEHIIRDESEYQAICSYILDNPVNWEKDKEFAK